MTATPIPRRPSSGYSLDEVARMRRMIVGAETEVECPRCGVATHRTTGTAPDGVVWFLHCGVCGRSVVISPPQGR